MFIGPPPERFPFEKATLPSEARLHRGAGSIPCPGAHRTETYGLSGDQNQKSQPGCQTFTGHSGHMAFLVDKGMPRRERYGL